jgi:hypothetical protein
MDLLDYLRPEAGNTKASYRASLRGAWRRKAPALLLAWLPPSLKVSEKLMFAGRSRNGS